MSLPYESGTEHQALRGACHGANRGIGPPKELKAVARIGNDEVAATGGRQSACAIPDRPDATPSPISLKGLGTGPGGRIKRGGGANMGPHIHERRPCRTGNWCERLGKDSAGLSSRVTSLLPNLCLIESHHARRSGAIVQRTRSKADRDKSATPPCELTGEARKRNAFVILGLAHPDRTADHRRHKEYQPESCRNS